MHKPLRNTAFTLVVVGLSAFGIGWSKQGARQTDPTVISQEVLASPAVRKPNSDFPLSLEFVRDRVKLGQYQQVTVRTKPFAELEVVTIYPNGSVNNPETLKATADELGNFTMKYKLSDFHFLGIFQVLVRATVSDAQAETSGRFVLQTWIEPNDRLDQNGYIYPLLP